MAIIKTPTIYGTNSIDYGQLNVPYTITNLDINATDVLTTPYCLGILSIHDFINNEDGTGSFQIDFSNSIYVYQLQIRVEDGINLSDVSNIIIIALFVDVITYGDLSAKPVCYQHNPLYENMIKEMPDCQVYNNHNNYTIPYSYHSSLWEVTIPYLGNILYYNYNNTNVKSIIPKGPIAIVKLDLPLGTSRVNFDYDGHKLSYSVGRVNFASLIAVYAQQIYTSTKKLQTLDGDYLSLLSSGILKVEKYLPNWKQLKNAVKYKAVQGLTSSNYEQVLSSYIGNNYYFNKVVLSDYVFENKYSNREHYNGYSIYWWSFFEKIEAWWTFSKLMSQIKNIQGIYKDQAWYESVTLTPTIEHFIKPNVFIDYDLNMKTLIDTTHRLIWNLNQKNWDTAYTIETPLGDRIVLDAGISWDTNGFIDGGYLFDGTDLDPGYDGWIGWSPYFKGNNDSVIMPQTICQTAQLKSIIAGAFDLGGLDLTIIVTDNIIPIETITYSFIGSGILDWTTDQVINALNGLSNYWMAYTDLTDRIYIDIVNGSYDIVVSGDAPYELGWTGSYVGLNISYAGGWNLNGTTLSISTLDLVGNIIGTDNIIFTGVNPYTVNQMVIEYNTTAINTIATNINDTDIYIKSTILSEDLRINAGTSNAILGITIGDIISMKQRGLNSQRAVKCTNYEGGWNLNGTTLIINTIDDLGAIISTDTVNFTGVDPYSINQVVLEYNATATTTIAYSKNNSIFCITTKNLDEGLKIGTGSSNVIFNWEDNEVIEGSLLQKYIPLKWSPATLSSMNLITPAMKLTFP